MLRSPQLGLIRRILHLIMATFSPAVFQTLALLRFRAATAGDKAIKTFQSYTYDRDDALEPFRFEALCRITSIARFSSSLPEYVSPLDCRELFRITADLLDEWIATSAEITGEVYALDPESLSPTGQRMVDFLAHILKPHQSVYNCLPSKSFRSDNPEPATQQQIILDFFEDCSSLLLPIRSEIRRSWLNGNKLERSTMSEIYAPLNTFIFAPAIHFFHWLLYYWRRHATTTPAVPFEKKVIEEYKPTYLKTSPDQPHEQIEEYLGRDPKVDAFWKTSKYPVRGVWGCLTVYSILRDLLEQNVRIAHERLFNSGVRMESKLVAIPKRPPTLFPKLQASSSYQSRHALLIQKAPLNRPQASYTSIKSAKPVSETGMFTCPSCTTPNHFTMQKDLRRHIESIHFKTGFYCTVPSCSRHAGGVHRPFNRWDNLARHMRRVHGK